MILPFFVAVSRVVVNLDTLMTDQEQPEDVNQLLEEESAEEEQFRLAHQNSSHLKPGVSVGLVHSPTTDTLDSVYLDEKATEVEFTDSGEISLDEKGEVEFDEKEEINIDQKQEDTLANIDHTAEVLELPMSADADLKEDKTMSSDIDLDGISLDIDRVDLDDLEIGAGTEIKTDSQPSLTKYFGTATADDPLADDFFSSLPPVDNEKSKTIDSNTAEVSEVEKDVDQDNIDDLLDLIIDDSQLRSSDVEVKNKDDNTTKRLSQHEPQPDAESVLFEMTEDVEETAPPVEIEDEKEDFESFTADLADTETMDALGMSPAATSFMTERNIQDYFRQTSQADSLRSLGLDRQLSNSSGTSSTKTGLSSQDHSSLPSGIEENQNMTNIPASDMVQQTIPSTGSEEKPSSVQEVHKASILPTLSPVESPAHQPVLRTRKDSQNYETVDAGRTSTGIPSLPGTPVHKPDVGPFQTFSESSPLEDPFAASLQMSDEDRCHDAWIPSEETKNILINMATSPPGTYIPQTEQLCMPVLVVTESQGDPVKDLVYRYMGEQEALKRHVLTADKVSQDKEGLKQLIVAGCLRSAVDLTGTLLMAVGFGEEQSEEPRVHSPEILQYWYCRFALLMKLRLYNIAETEFQAFKNLDTPDIYYDFYPQIYPGKRGSMVAFGMRLLHAELPHHLGRSQETLDRLYYILAVTQKILKNLEDGL